MDHFKNILSAIFTTVLLLIIYSCSNDSMDPAGDKTNTTCDTIDVSFDKEVKPILERSCLNCHKASSCASIGGNTCFETHAQIKTLTDAGYIVPNIEHRSGFKSMPKGAGKLPACEIALIRNWVKEGAKNN
jgi:hypothetical protein